MKNICNDEINFRTFMILFNMLYINIGRMTNFNNPSHNMKPYKCQYSTLPFNKQFNLFIFTYRKRSEIHKSTLDMKLRLCQLIL